MDNEARVQEILKRRGLDVTPVDNFTEADVPEPVSYTHLVIARSTAGFSGADLENLTNESALLAARRDEKFITMQDMHEAMIKVIAGPEKKSHVIPEQERRLTAYHEAGHAIVMHELPGCDPVHQITIIPRGSAGGMTISLPGEDHSLSLIHIWAMLTRRLCAIGALGTACRFTLAAAM